ncbi:hypothetical protein [Winogradskyella luteola]|uniref:Outer membrane protein beta-barrel domain-containing protein n=1 Tax=Winogradskyella luteola TaxID=2828330 RepID=A0A9X1JRY4_9FLAO|nr:hypothetical protein [Winogradskyella luteola]MBV7269077.1 hypothetical protein [Winogradskyella luteola]
MKNLPLAFIALTVFVNFSLAQNISYGPTIGGLFYEVNNNHGTGVARFSSDANPAVSFGGYLEYNFYKKMGLKAELSYSSPKIKQDVIDNPPTTKLGFVEISPSFKYNFGVEYNKGFLS